MFQDEYELPYFDEAGNQFFREINKQDAYVKRGGRLTAPQMIKYENRVAMLVERLVLILDAVKGDPEAVHDYLESIEQTKRMGILPRDVYKRFNDKVHEGEGQAGSSGSERDRDRQRVIHKGVREETSGLADLPVGELLDKCRQQVITREVLFQQLQMREKAGIRLERMDPDLWGRYRNWVAEKRRIRQSRRFDGK